MLSGITDGKLSEQALGYLSEQQQKDLKSIRDRKMALQSKLNERDVQSLL